MTTRRKKRFQGVTYLFEFIYLFVYVFIRQGKTGELYHSKWKFSSSFLLSDVATCHLKAESKEKEV